MIIEDYRQVDCEKYMNSSKLHKRLKLIREFEEAIPLLVSKRKILGPTHTYVGQEAIAVGVCESLSKDDIISSTHRGHGHVLAKGGNPKRMMAELMGKVDGYNRGKGGSMHIADLSLGIYGTNGIVGGGVPIACGIRTRGRFHG